MKKLIIFLIGLFFLLDALNADSFFGKACLYTNVQGKTYYVISNTPPCKLEWDASTDPDVVGYNIYYGTNHMVYTKTIPVGNVIFFLIPIGSLLNGLNYVFAATALDSVGLESDFSNEVSYHTPGPVHSSTNLTAKVGP